MPSRAASVSKQAQALGRTATIRSVPSFEGSETGPESNHASGLSSSVTSKASNLSTVVSAAPAETETARPSPDNTPRESPEQHKSNDVSNGHSAAAAVDPEPAVAVAVADPASVPLEDNGDEHGDSAQWDSTIGKAGLGKTGRVINKLVSDNEALKREIKIEKLRAEEARQAAKLVEDKMERMINDYESRLLEANVTKTLLARKERQVETLLATVDTEKKKTVAAQELERNWRDEMEKVRRDAKTQVDDATSYAQLMEGRYNAISSHWRDQGDEVNKAICTIKTEINTIVDERKSDDDKIQTLRDLCEQQDSNIQKLRREKEDIARLFEEYKKAQEDNLRDIKENARKTEEEQQRILEESRETLHKLRWALKVKENVKGAE
ncbi:hypothetical protein BBK36DRAFT_1124832 [Trichoderma citrinoviride]|uniref:SWI5-dependent HO expression protein 3 n=1 Tax=Trichoderma citrinoviride TaxID=58853 RepID=A0A2T4B590_9HYPO|nr:hypothetical protein BBK36DRAFT_1124832 [Trichoderma citrinoviride]PTB64470.1 hypothetical protein BBK36DRAFT_1124832 [Trichoderma citrinoviride]